MLLKVFSVRDMKAEAFLQPFFCPTQGSALRAFGDACSKPESPFFLHPNDYVLYEIGSYDDSNAVLGSVSPVVMMACAADFAEKVPPPNVSKKEFDKILSDVGVNHGS